MTRILSSAVSIVLVCATLSSAADEYRAEALDAAPPSEGVAPAILEQLQPKGIKVVQGPSKLICEIWPCKSWKLTPDFKPSLTVQYPFEMGQLIGLVRFARKTNDFRGQQIPKGVYTLRYAHQPVDGNHVGTSDTRDFLLMLKIADDTTVDPLEKKDLFKRSAKSANSTHPAMLTLLQAPEASVDLPAMEHVESRELWAVKFTSQGTAGDKEGSQGISLVVVGRAPE